FFFQAEDGIRDFHVTGVQTCALPICGQDNVLAAGQRSGAHPRRPEKAPTALPIGQSKQPGNPDAPSYGSARRHRARRLATLPALAGPGLLRAARLGGGAGLLALVPGVAVVAARRQAGVLGEQLADLLAAGRRGILAARRLIAAIGGRLVGRDQLVLA